MKWICKVCGYIAEGDALPDECPICGVGAEMFEIYSEDKNDIQTNDTDETFVIIGGGAAAYECAVSIRERNKTCAVLIFSAEKILPYYRPSLSKLIAGGVAVDKILLEKQSFYDELNITIRMDMTVTKLDAKNKKVILADGESTPYNKVCICTGARAFNPIKASENGVPMQTLRMFEDALKLIDLAKNKKNALIIGGGILGIEVAESIVKLGVNVTVAELSGRILSAQPDEAKSAEETARLEGMGIKILTNISAVETTESGVMLKDGRQIDADFVLVSAGIRSNISIAEESEIAVGRGIIVDEAMRTNIENVFAAGDCAELKGKVAGLWMAAVEQGEIAGLSMTADVSE